MIQTLELKSHFEVHLKDLVLSRIPPSLEGLREMVSYHFGWNQTNPKAGKRLRPMLMLISAQTFGVNPLTIMPAAVAMEVLHNYTLIHDDIEDQGETRHGKECLWRRYGLPHALNVGDYLSTISHDIFCEVSQAAAPQAFTKAYQIFRQSTIDVLHGQYQDMLFETKPEVLLDDYLGMIRLKTSSLISASMRIGASLAGLDADTLLRLEQICDNVGLAFQIQDDYLGIWGDSVSTGKSNLTDLSTRKKTYPVLLGLAQSPTFRHLWDGSGQITPEISRQMAKLLEKADIHLQTAQTAYKYLSGFNDSMQEIATARNLSAADFLAIVNSAFAPTHEALIASNG